MNLRIAPEHIRLRIHADEFQTLLRTGVLNDSTPLSDTLRLDYSLHFTSTARSLENHTLELTTTSTAQGSHFAFLLFADGMAHLNAAQNAKNGIREHLVFAHGERLSIGLEIDLHSKKGAA